MWGGIVLLEYAVYVVPSEAAVQASVAMCLKAHQPGR